jgi:transcriptional regulator with XRE-family HTH domain
MHDDILIKIGKKIRETRQKQQIKLHELAEEAQISKGLLSKIETGRTIPSLPVLISVIQTLKVDMSAFFEGIEMQQSTPYIHKKSGEYTPFEKEEAFGFLYQFILSHHIANTAFEAVILELKPHSKREKVVTDGFEFKYVLSGEVEYQLGDEIVVLQTGDSLFFNGRIPHVPVNKTGHPAIMLVIYLLLPPR